MSNLLIALVIVFGGWWLVRQFANAQPARVRGLIKKVAGGGVMALAALMAMRGGITTAMPLFILGLGLFGQQAVFPDGMPWNRKSTGQKSRVTTSLLVMELDHDSSAMDGQVLQGPLKGRSLTSLTPTELRALHRQCGTVPDQSRALFEAWLDRSRPGWREQWGGKRDATAATATGRMTAKEARAVLGLKDGAVSDDIRAAHRRLMKEFHPDHGGSDYLAAKINEAKDVLLQEAGART